MRTTVITGVASGIGAALAAILRERGERVIGVDVREADIVADLTTTDGRASLPTRVRELAPDGIDAVVANAGLALPVPATIAVNYFGALATLEGLRPLLERSAAPRAAATASMASLYPPDDALLELLAADDEASAMERGAALAADESTENLIYGTTKLALAKWIRRAAPTDRWAGAGIPLNAIAPGIVVTPMTHDLMATEEAVDALLQQVPMPLNGPMEATAPADLLAWLISPTNSHLCGQVVFIDGGSDVVIRGDSTW